MTLLADFAIENASALLSKWSIERQQDQWTPPQAIADLLSLLAALCRYDPDPPAHEYKSVNCGPHEVYSPEVYEKMRRKYHSELYQDEMNTTARADAYHSRRPKHKNNWQAEEVGY